MKDIIARLRELHTDWEKYEKREPHEPQPYSDQIAEALPQLLDRLEKLEAVTKQVADIANEALSHKDSEAWYSALDDISYILDSGCGALAALEGEKK